MSWNQRGGESHIYWSLASVLGRHSNVTVVSCSEVSSSDSPVRETKFYLVIYLEILHSGELIQSNLNLGMQLLGRLNICVPLSWLPLSKMKATV